MRTLYLDCFSGISGDMTVGALCDLGVKPSALEWELSKLALGDWHAHFERAQRQHIHGVQFAIHEAGQGSCSHHSHDHSHQHEHSHEHSHSHSHHSHSSHHSHEHQHDEHHGHHHCSCEDHEHSHSHEHEHHGHHHPHAHGRTHADIQALIIQSSLSDFVKKHALSIFQRIAVAEGKIHGVPPEKVTFHEVGALDSIADIVLACVGIEQLGIEKVFVSSLHDGVGFIDCAHGRFPIPAAATLEILQGIPFKQVDEPYEFITPTGAAIVAEFGAAFGPMPQMKVTKVGYGIGTRIIPSRPNVLRAVLGEMEEAPAPEPCNTHGYETDQITRLETNLDDLSPEITGAIMDKLLAAGALDVYFTPIQMKKNRPAIQLSVLCEHSEAIKLADIIFAETTAFGLRQEQINRLKLDRRFEKVTTPYGDITVKVGSRGGKPIQIAPEFESCRIAADMSGASLRAVYEAARMASFQAKG